MRRDNDLADRESRLAIAQAIREFLHVAGQSRKVLIDREPCKLSESTVNKVFRGEFSERTLTMIEAMLGHSFRGRKRAPNPDAGADDSRFDATAPLQGDYFCARPLFTNPTQLSTCTIHIAWDNKHDKFVFAERARADAKHLLEGSVHLPDGLPFMYLECTNAKNIRNVILSLPDADGLCRGIISTLSNPRRASNVRACAPIFLQRLAPNDRPQCGIITPADPRYAKYRDKLASVTAEEFDMFVAPPGAPHGRRELTMAVAGA